METLYYYYHPGSDTVFIDIETDFSIIEDVETVGICHKRTLEELVRLIYEHNPNSYIFNSISDDLIKELNLK